MQYVQALQCELVEKEILLSAYYKENYSKIIEAHNNTTIEILSEPIKGEKDLSFLNDSEQRLYTSYCLLNKYCMKFSFVSEGAIYLLGYEYSSIISAVVNAKKIPPLEDLFGALSEKSRVQILRLLLERKEVTCKDLERIFSFSGSTAYHHISLLTRCGAVKVRNEGKTIYYSLNAKFFNMMIKQLKLFINN
jgi:DNA-binding transcriptional ArsR family regulator